MDVKSSSTGGSLAHLKQGSNFCLPMNTLRAHTRCWCARASNNKNKFACTIGRVATILCISWDVGIGGESCRMLRGRRPSGSKAPCAMT